MNLLHRVPLLTLVLMLAWATSPRAQQAADTSDATTPPPGSTVITADELHSDQLNHTSVFNGNVIVVGTNFNLTCDEMNVLFTKDGKVDHIIATGNVVINQPGRVTHSGQVDYYREDDKFCPDRPARDRAGQEPDLRPENHHLQSSQTMITEGKPTKVVLVNGGFSSGTSTPSRSPSR